MKDLKTTFAGIVTGSGVILDALLKAYEVGAFTGKHGIELVCGIGIVLLGAWSADSKKTTNP